jgi:hypothetical protein
MGIETLHKAIFKKSAPACFIFQALREKPSVPEAVSGIIVVGPGGLPNSGES